MHQRAAASPLLHRLLHILLLTVVVTSPGCVTTDTNPVSRSPEFYGYSWAQEVKLGDEADEQIRRKYGIYDDEELRAYVERIGQDLLSESHMRRPETPAKFRNTEFHFRLLNSPVMNAFALPGGYVYITRGLLAHLNNEAQLAVGLGHGIGHVAGRHASKQAANQLKLDTVVRQGRLLKLPQ